MGCIGAMGSQLVLSIYDFILSGKSSRVVWCGRNDLGSGKWGTFDGMCASLSYLSFLLGILDEFLVRTS